MTQLANFLQVNLNYKMENYPLFKEPAKIVVFFLREKHYIIATYLIKFPLMSRKYLIYLFSKGLDYLGKRLTEQEILEIRAIKSSMNKSRTYYKDHLNNFYT